MEKRLPSLSLNFIMNAVLAVSAVIFPLVTTPYVSRILLPEGTGKVALAVSVISYFNLFAQLGIPTYGIRACAQVRDDRGQLSCVVRELLFLNLLMSLASYAVLAAALVLVPRLRAEWTLYAVVSLTILLNTLGMEWLYKGLEQYTFITVRSVAFKAVAVAAMFLLVRQRQDYVIYGGITVLASSASYVCNLIYTRRYVDLWPRRIGLVRPFGRAVRRGGSASAGAGISSVGAGISSAGAGVSSVGADISLAGTDNSLAGAAISSAGTGSSSAGVSSASAKTDMFRPWRHMKAVAVFFAMSCSVVIYTNLDTVMLGFMRGDAEVGYYNAAVKIKTVLVSVVASLGSVLLPRVSYYAEQGMREEFEQLGRRALKFVILAAAPAAVFFMIFADRAIGILAGPAYMAAVPAMRIIMPTVLLIGITNILGIQILVPLGRERAVLASEVAGALVDLVLNLLLIPEYGAAGAAWGTLAAETVVLAVQVAAVWRLAAGRRSK